MTSVRGAVAIGVVVGLFTGALLGGCAGSAPTAASETLAPAGALLPTLRLVNAGTVSVAGLVVVFPDERVEFGDVPAGTTTVYQPFSRGVYQYAAYQTRVGDRIVSQPVVDWVGEVPMRGEAFTYTIVASEGPPWGVNIRLVGVTQDR